MAMEWERPDRKAEPASSATKTVANALSSYAAIKRQQYLKDH